ncbi:hypothetical protein, partial [Xylanibacter rarus]|uniref:hypothetical protein n=1 Tax=Xylanibacter rarus TaxID=1676614 RepID=UPI003AB929BD
SFPKHYVAIVPADLRSAGIKYKDLLIRLLPILSLHHLYFTLISGTFSRSKISCADLRFLYHIPADFSLCSTIRANQPAQ